MNGAAPGLRPRRGSQHLPVRRRPGDPGGSAGASASARITTHIGACSVPRQSGSAGASASARITTAGPGHPVPALPEGSAGASASARITTTSSPGRPCRLRQRRGFGLGEDHNTWSRCSSVSGATAAPGLRPRRGSQRLVLRAEDGGIQQRQGFGLGEDHNVFAHAGILLAAGQRRGFGLGEDHNSISRLEWLYAGAAPGLRPRRGSQRQHGRRGPHRLSSAGASASAGITTRSPRVFPPRPIEAVCSAGTGSVSRRQTRASGWPGRTRGTTAAGSDAAPVAGAARRVRAAASTAQGFRTPVVLAPVNAASPWGVQPAASAAMTAGMSLTRCRPVSCQRSPRAAKYSRADPPLSAGGGSRVAAVADGFRGRFSGRFGCNRCTPSSGLSTGSPLRGSGCGGCTRWLAASGPACPVLSSRPGQGTGTPARRCRLPPGRRGPWQG